MLKLKSKLLGIFALVVVLGAPATAHAIASPTLAGGGITVSPAELLFNLNTAAASQIIPITLTNGYNAAVSISAVFSGIDENADLLIPVDNLDPTFASALSISQTQVTLPAHASQVLNVQVTNLSSLSAGGHYATLVLTQQDVKGKPLSIKGAVSLTIFVVKNPGAYQSIALTGISTNHSLFRLPTTASLGFNNSGNVLIVPRATVLVFSHDGHTVLEKGVANQTSYSLLPGKQLQNTVRLPVIAHTWIPQRVHLEVVYRADGASGLSTATGSFWYIPPIYLLLLLPIGWLLWRPIDRRRRRGHPLPDSITRVPPLGIMRRIQATTRRIFIIDRDEATPVKVTVTPPLRELRLKKTRAATAKATPKRTTPPKLPPPKAK